VVYIEELIGPDTVTTIPPATFEAFRDHGRPRASLVEDVEAAADTMATLGEVGISMNEVTDKLLIEGVELFSDSFQKVLMAVEKQAREPGAGRLNRLTHTLPGPLAATVQGTLAEWRARARSGGSGAGMHRCGAAGMKRSGSAGSASQTASSPTLSG
jgi:transaldolase/glucose-6-phosphate isomerase